MFRRFARSRIQLIFIIILLACAFCLYQKTVNTKSIDVVYTWVNGSDSTFASSMQNAFDQTNGFESPKISGYQDNEQLRYSLRSVEKYATWIRDVYIVTNGQVPSWLNRNNKRIHLVQHSEIFANQDHLPTFSSPAIEVHLHKIKGISEKFLYFNDDYLLGNMITEEDFETKAGGHKIYLSDNIPPISSVGLQVVGSMVKVRISNDAVENVKSVDRKIDNIIEPYVGSLNHVSHVFDLFYGAHFDRQVAHMPHLIHREIMEKLQRELPMFYDRTSSHKFRHNSDMQLAQSFFNYVRFAKSQLENTRTSKTRRYKSKMLVKNNNVVFIPISNDVSALKEELTKIQSNPPKFICLNDNLDYKE